jgi:Rps23 Pro-64 3,4-dihydroxylase Tpa1-like proline 4-hydroxylase
MITYQDDFFDSLSFKFLQSLIDNSIDYQALELEHQWKRHSDYYSSDLSVIKQQYGAVYYSIFQKVKLFSEELTNSELGFHSFRLQATTDNKVSYLHYDRDITQQGPENSFTSIIYLHKTWNADYGGQFYTNNISIDPVPNRLVFYSRDEYHGVMPANASWPEPRKLILLSWYKI